MAEEPAGFLSTIQIGITLAGFLGSAFAAESFSGVLTAWLYDIVGIRVLSEKALGTVSVVLITVILSYFTLIFGELVPKRIAMQKPYAVARIASRPVAAIAFVMKPVIGFLAVSTNGVLRCLHMETEAKEEPVTEDEIRLMLDLGNENGAIEAGEREWIQNVFEFNDTTVQEAMTREFEVISIRMDDPDEEILEKIRKTGLSRFPVYDEEGRDLKGILYAREYLINRNTKEVPDLSALLHPAYFVPESIHTDRLFQDMRKKKVHMAVAVDEYGEISGIITMEDLLEEIVGNIYDEFDPAAEQEIWRLEENLWRFPGTTMIKDAGEALGMELPKTEEYETIGGLVLSLSGAIPKENTSVEAEGLSILVERVANRRIESLLVKKTGDEKNGNY